MRRSSVSERSIARSRTHPCSKRRFFPIRPTSCRRYVRSHRTDMRAATHAPRTLTFLLLVMLGARANAALTVETLRSISSLPPHIVGLFEEPLGFQQTPEGPYYVFDRRGHTVYTVDAGKIGVRKLV